MMKMQNDTTTKHLKNKTMKELSLIMTKLLISTFLALWMLLTCLLCISIIGVIVLIEDQWWYIGDKLVAGLLK